MKRQEKNEILIEHRISRHTLPTLLYFLFSPPHIFNFSANPHLSHWHAAQANASTKALEKQIDQLVYELYGLTEEIAIIEGSVK